MKYFLVLIAVIQLCTSFAQSPEELNRQDSMRRVIKRRMVQQQIYDRMFAEDPKKAIDSLIAANKMFNAASGEERLRAYTSNYRIDTLKEINLTYAGLSEVPLFVREAEAIEVLILDFNSIRKLPGWLNDLPNLKRIYWRGNNLEDVWWIRIPRIERLEKLDLGNNTLTRVPLGIKKLGGLVELVLDENLFSEIPVWRLKRADFVETVSLNKIPHMEIGKADYHKLSFIKILKINNCGVEAIDPSFYRLTGLTELQLQENRLGEIPTGISQLTNLTKLSFYKNELKSLPPDLFELKDLVVIDLYHNQLEVIPDELGNLRNLEVLFLSNNRIYSLPESIGQLHDLRKLYLHHNRLSALPASLAKLDLEVARVNDNYLIDFPTQFLAMKKLEDLDISNNQIGTIPGEVEKLSDLRLFTYQQNPIDFKKPTNGHLAPMIIRMIESGTICVPRVYQEVQESAQ